MHTSLSTTGAVSDGSGITSIIHIDVVGPILGGRPKTEPFAWPGRSASSSIGSGRESLSLG